MDSRQFLCAVARVDGHRKEASWKPNAINLGAAGGSAIISAANDVFTRRTAEENDKHRKEIEELKGRQKGEATTVFGKAGLLAEEAKLKLNEFRTEHPTLSAILSALTGAATGYTAGSLASSAFSEHQRQNLPPNRRVKIAEKEDEKEDEEKEEREEKEPKKDKEGPAHEKKESKEEEREEEEEEREKEAGPAIDALNEVFTEYLPSAVGGAFGAIRGAYESPDPDLRILAAILPALLSAGGAQVGTELGEIGGHMLSPLFKDPKNLMAIAKAIGGVSGGAGGYRTASMLNEMLIPPKARPRESQYKESLASCEYAVREHRATFGPKDNEKSFARDHKKPDLQGDGKVRTNEGKVYRVMLTPLPHEEKMAFPNNPQINPQGMAYNYAQLPPVQQQAWQYSHRTPAYSSAQAPHKNPEEGGAWNTVKKYLPTALTLGAGAGLGVLGVKAWNQLDKRTKNLNELMRHMHGAEHGAEREAMKALPQGQIDALHNMAKNMDPAELMYMRHNPSLIEEAKGFMNTESADSFINKVRGMANPPPPPKPTAPPAA